MAGKGKLGIRAEDAHPRVAARLAGRMKVVSE